MKQMQNEGTKKTLPTRNNLLFKLNYCGPSHEKKQVEWKHFSDRLLRRESPLDKVVKKLCSAHTIALYWETNKQKKSSFFPTLTLSSSPFSKKYLPQTFPCCKKKKISAEHKNRYKRTLFPSNEENRSFWCFISLFTSKEGQTFRVVIVKKSI